MGNFLLDNLIADVPCVQTVRAMFGIAGFFTYNQRFLLDRLIDIWYNTRMEKKNICVCNGAIAEDEGGVAYCRIAVENCELHTELKDLNLANDLLRKQVLNMDGHNTKLKAEFDMVRAANRYLRAQLDNAKETNQDLHDQYQDIGHKLNEAIDKHR